MYTNVKFTSFNYLISPLWRSVECYARERMKKVLKIRLTIFSLCGKTIDYYILLIVYKIFWTNKNCIVIFQLMFFLNIVYSIYKSISRMFWDTMGTMVFEKKNWWLWWTRNRWKKILPGNIIYYNRKFGSSLIYLQHFRAVISIRSDGDEDYWLDWECHHERKILSNFFSTSR